MLADLEKEIEERISILQRVKSTARSNLRPEDPFIDGHICGGNDVLDYVKEKPKSLIDLKKH